MTVVASDCLSVAESIAQNKGVIVDVRGSISWSEGTPKGAILITADDLRKQAKQLKSQQKQIFIICHEGNLSLQLSIELGSGFISVLGGYNKWLLEKLPVEMSVDNGFLRYDRQLKLAGFGMEEQEKLRNAHVLVVGLGGLGSPAASYLVAAGVGEITLVDDDVIALHNLHRQVFYQENDVEQSKVSVASKRFKKLNTAVQVNAVAEKLNQENAHQLIQSVDLVIDGSDNLSTRYVINEACLKYQIPWVFAAVSGFNVQVAVFTGAVNDLCFRCLFTDIPDDAIGNCNEEGILGPIPGIAAMIQAAEGLKYLTGIGSHLKHQMLNFDLLNHEYKVLKYPPNSNRCALHNQTT